MVQELETSAAGQIFNPLAPRISIINTLSSVLFCMCEIVVFLVKLEGARASTGLCVDVSSGVMI